MKINKDKIIENKLSMFPEHLFEKWEDGIETYNITVKCNTYYDREKVLNMIDYGTLTCGDTLRAQGIIQYHDNYTLFFNEDYTNGPRFSNELRYL